MWIKGGRQQTFKRSLCCRISKCDKIKGYIRLENGHISQSVQVVSVMNRPRSAKEMQISHGRKHTYTSLEEPREGA